MSFPKVLIALRTHMWNAATDLAFEKLRASQHELVITVDETRGIVPTPAGYEKLSHSTARFEAMGLPLYPSPEEAMWYNGDYPLYDLLARKDFDYVMMVEGDAVLLGDVDALIRRLIRNRVDFSVKNFGRRHKGYRWRTQSLNWFSVNWEDPVCHGGIFPILFASRAVVEDLREARLLMARQLARSPKRWVHCEPFAATQVAMRGFKGRALSRYVDVANCTAGYPILPDYTEWFDPRELRLLHPVVVEPDFTRKMVVDLRECSRNHAKRWREAEVVLPLREEELRQKDRVIRRLETAVAELTHTLHERDDRVEKLTVKVHEQQEKLRFARDAWRNRPRTVLDLARARLRRGLKR